MLFIKGFIIGLGKIIPGVSGALLAINFGIYERLLSAITNFKSKPKENIKFLLPLVIGIILAIILGSKVILYLINHFEFVTMLFFLGLMLGGTFKFSEKIKFSKKGIIVLIIMIGGLLVLKLLNINTNLSFSNGLTFFIGGYIEILASIIPGISGTSLLMMMGIYDKVLNLVANVYDLNYILSNFHDYLFYSIGIIVSLIVNAYLVNYLIKKYPNASYIVILGLAIISMLSLLIMMFGLRFSLWELFLGIGLFVLGMFGGKKLA